MSDATVVERIAAVLAQLYRDRTIVERAMDAVQCERATFAARQDRLEAAQAMMADLEAADAEHFRILLVGARAEAMPEPVREAGS